MPMTSSLGIFLRKHPYHGYILRFIGKGKNSRILIPILCYFLPLINSLLSKFQQIKLIVSGENISINCA